MTHGIQCTYIHDDFPSLPWTLRPDTHRPKPALGVCAGWYSSTYSLILQIRKNYAYFYCVLVLHVIYASLCDPWISHSAPWHLPSYIMVIIQITILGCCTVGARRYVTCDVTLHWLVQNCCEWKSSVNSVCPTLSWSWHDQLAEVHLQPRKMADILYTRFDST